jgi:hypothetical protein
MNGAPGRSDAFSPLDFLRRRGVRPTRLVRPSIPICTERPGIGGDLMRTKKSMRFLEIPRSIGNQVPLMI